MKRIDDQILEGIFETRVVPGLPEHVCIAVHKAAHLLVAARSLQDVDVIGQILRWPGEPARLGVKLCGKWHLTFQWFGEEVGALMIRLVRR